MLDAATRLVELLDHPRDASALAPLYERKLLGRLLTAEQRARQAPNWSEIEVSSDLGYDVRVAGAGLRERKKARTRRLIADTAARLFAERGYEHVAVSDVAREAEVAEQTVYNYFGTKEQLVTDRDEEVQDRLIELIRSRPPDVSSAAAIRDFVLETVAGIRSIPKELWRGELGYLAAISPAVHRLALEMTDRQAAAVAAAISDTTDVAPEVAKLQGIALASVFQIIISEAGRRTLKGESQAKIARELYPMVENVLDELDRWLSVPPVSAGGPAAAPGASRPRRRR
jgi:AcrR family transcriptional regulator